MDSLKLPSVIKPFAFAKKNLTFNAKFNTAELKALEGVVNSGNVDIELTFSIKNRIAFAAGSIDIAVQLSCVNCFQNVDFIKKNIIKVAFVSGDFDEKSLDEYEIIDCDFDGEILATDFVSDEVLLALPMFAKHTECCIQTNTSEEVEESIPTKENPFAVLKDIYK
jgi:uncharacterized protein